MIRKIAPLLAAFVVSVFGTGGWASADSVTGLDVSAYLITDVPPQMSDSVYEQCNSYHVSRIQDSWGGGVVGGCRYEQVMLHYSGVITIPAGVPFVQFLVYSDDGGYVDIGGNGFGYWADRGCGGTVSPLYAGVQQNTSYPINAWFYENGGGACFFLYWNIGDGWTVVPDSAYSSAEPVPTTTSPTTTEAPTTTSTSTSVAPSSTQPVISTTTTVAPLGMRSPTNLQGVAGDGQVSLTWDAPEGGQGYAEVERYAVFWSSDNFQSGFAIASYTTSAVVGNLENGVEYKFKVRADNDSLAVYSSWYETYVVTLTPQSTTTTSSSTTTTSTTTTTTTVATVSSVDEPQNYEPTPETSEVEVVEEDPTTTTELVEVVDTVVETSPLPMEESQNEPTLPLEVIVEAPTETLTLDVVQLTEEEVVALSADLETATAAEVAELFESKSDSEIEQFLAEVDSSEALESVVDALADGELELTTSQLAAVIENPVLEELSKEVIQEVFAALEPEALSDEQVEAITEVLNQASDTVKSAFQEEVNIFGGVFNDYVPLGSVITVQVRRTVVAGSVVLCSVPTVSVGRRS
jgi:hypothetical protein